jgi:hypothetical protein
MRQLWITLKKLFSLHIISMTLIVKWMDDHEQT